MAEILNISDFGAGKYELHTGMYTVDKLQDYIDRYEARYLIDLLGATLYAEFIADLVAGVPQSPKFEVIFNALSVEGPNCVKHSEGIKDLLKGFIYFEYAKDLINQMTSIGNTVPTGENSEKATTLYTTFYNRYNEAVRSYRVIQYYICSNPENYDYSAFKGNKKMFNTWL
jgi:hypothetical protein